MSKLHICWRLCGDHHLRNREMNRILYVILQCYRYVVEAILTHMLNDLVSIANHIYATDINV